MDTCFMVKASGGPSVTTMLLWYIVPYQVSAIPTALKSVAHILAGLCSISDTRDKHRRTEQCKVDATKYPITTLDPHLLHRYRPPPQLSRALHLESPGLASSCKLTFTTVTSSKTGTLEHNLMFHYIYHSYFQSNMKNSTTFWEAALMSNFLLLQFK